MWILIWTVTHTSPFVARNAEKADGWRTPGSLVMASPLIIWPTNCTTWSWPLIDEGIFSILIFCKTWPLCCPVVVSSPSLYATDPKKTMIEVFYSRSQGNGTLFCIFYLWRNAARVWVTALTKILSKIDLFQFLLITESIIWCLMGTS